MSDEKSIFIKGEKYFCFKLHISSKDDTVLYSLVNSYGEIALYNEKDFEVLHGSLDDMSFHLNGNGIYHLIQLNKISELDSKTKINNGNWGGYNEGNKEVEKIPHAIILELATKEGYVLERINTL